MSCMKLSHWRGKCALNDLRNELFPLVLIELNTFSGCVHDAH